MWKSVVAPAVVVSSFWLIVGGSTTFYLFWQSRTLDRLLDESVTSVRAANEMQETAWQIHSTLLQAVGGGTQVSGQSFNDLERQFEQALALADSSKMPEVQSLAGQIRKDFTDFSVRSRKVVADPNMNQMMLLELLPPMSKITESCKEIIRFNEHYLRSAAQGRQQLTAWVVCVRLAMLVIGPGLGLMLGFRIASQLRRSMTNISVSLQTVAGHLEQEIGQLEITAHPDLPAIQRQLDLIADRMRGVVQELQQSRRETMRAERLAAVGELAAGVAHELRNPLTSVKLLIQTMQHRQQTMMPEQSFNVVLEEILRMETTIQALLDFARPPVPRRALHDLQVILRRAVNLTDGKARQCDVDVILHFAESPVWVQADADQLHQVFINLLLNGIESMVDGGSLDVRVVPDESASIVTVRFEDTGAGIPDSIIPRLFEPFVTSKDHGTGLGLAVSRRIIVNHSGQVTAENRPEGGAAMTITLPLEHIPIGQVESHAQAVAG